MLSRRSLFQAAAAGPLLASTLPVTDVLATPNPAAPDFTVDGWLNTPVPLTLTGLRGRVVLVDFWTYSCINCRRTVPYLNRWQAEYGTKGLQVVGIHTPEFGFERMRHNVEDAVREFGIHYPVGQDNEFKTWRAWSNQAWPTFYLLDRDGSIVLVREGEGHAKELEGAIRALLGLTASSVEQKSGDDPDLSQIRTDEIYFGATHPTPQDRAQQPRQGQANYTFPVRTPRLGEYQLDGSWERAGEALILRSPHGGVRMRFSAAKLHLVAAAEAATIQVAIDGQAASSIEIGRPTLYTVFDGTVYGEHALAIEASTPGLSLFSATFG